MMGILLPPGQGYVPRGGQFDDVAEESEQKAIKRDHKPIRRAELKDAT